MKVVVVDDHPLFRDALVNLINRIYENITVFQFDSYTALFEFIDEDKIIPDCLFIDLNMPGGEPEQNIIRIRKYHSNLPIVVITGSESSEDKNIAMNSGANYFLSKSIENKQLENSVTNIIKDNVLNSSTFLKSNNQAKNGENPINQLTSRQKEVYDLICNGDTNKMIAKKLNLTEGTVKLHVRAILQTLGVNNRTQAVSLNQNNH